MKITRKIDTTRAEYTLENINDEQFTFLLHSLTHYARYTHMCIPSQESVIGELISKVEKMKESSITIIQ